MHRDCSRRQTISKRMPPLILFSPSFFCWCIWNGGSFWSSWVGCPSCVPCSCPPPAAGEGKCWEESPDAVPALLRALGSDQHLLATKTKLSTVGKIKSISGRPKTARNSTSFQEVYIWFKIIYGFHNAFNFTYPCMSSACNLSLWTVRK